MPNEPLDHYISRAPPDAVADVHGELDNLARVADGRRGCADQDAGSARRTEAKAFAAAATAEMGLLLTTSRGAHRSRP